jgi:Lysophospholipase
MTESGMRFSASDGKVLVYRRSLPSSTPRAVVLIGHGMNDHSGRFVELAEALTEIGIAVYIPDLRGHGDTDTGENRGYLADKDGFRRVLDDLVELGDFAAKEQNDVPLFYFGHSFGALLGMGLCSIYGKYLDGVVLSAPPEQPSGMLRAAGKLVVAIGSRLRGSHAPAKLPRNMTFGNYNKTVDQARTASDWITRDNNVVDAYLADPKCNFVCSYGFYADLMDGLDMVYAPGFLESVPTNLPIYLFCGSRDPVIGMREGFDRLVQSIKALNIVDFETRCYEGGRHESINELNKDEVITDIVDWCSRHIAQ